MQELMQWMEETEFMVNVGFIDKVNECLEKEKEQIMQSYNDGYVNKAFDRERNPLEYYNRTYNQNK